ncbi:MAG: glycosyl hydrolase family 28-related protein [Isosphaeraceae bacterium]|nr:glycosyl hydrolase family 28-related protein [Isosphaeraceae bacterium]
MNAFVIVVGISLCAGNSPISGVTARATSEQVRKLFGAENLVSDSGLTDSGRGDGSRFLAVNGYTDGGCMWHSGYVAHGGDENAIVEFDLGRVHTVGEFHVWNHNANPGRGFREVSVTISDDGKTWRSLDQRFDFAEASGRPDYTGERYRFEPAIRARRLRFHCDSTHRAGGQRELAGLGKVRFFEAAAGSPSISPADRPSGDLPTGSGVVDLSAPPYSAKGDGVVDDAPALQRAIDDFQGAHKVLHLPRGVYRLSKPLKLKPGKGYGYNNIRGAGVDRTTLRLDDGILADPAKPRAVLSLAFNGREDGSGVHADWFNNNISDLTIDAGRNNPGAIGLQYYSNNVGALRNVRIRSADGRGRIGLDLGYADQNGPCLIKGIEIEGFAQGMSTGATVNSQTLEHVKIRGATEIGWENGGQCIAIRGLDVESGGVGFRSKFGVVALIEARFKRTGSGTASAAIETSETLFARDIAVEGYARAIANSRKSGTPTPDAAGPKVEEWVSTPALTLGGDVAARSLRLPIRETPEPALPPLADWVDIRRHRSIDDPDDSAALARAIDAGARVVYFPSGGKYLFGEPVVLGGKLERIVGFAAEVGGTKGPGKWITAEGAGKTLVIEGLRGDIFIEHRAKRELVVRDVQGVSGALVGGGELFLENVTADWDFASGNVWARQFNNEREGTHVRNAGAKLWILGYKTERGGTLIETTKGGSTELLGGLSYTTTQGKLAPMFISEDADVSYVFGEVCYSGDPFTRIIEERRGGRVLRLDRGEAPLRPSFLQGSELPLFVGRK